jgi:hypothetical protein
MLMLDKLHDRADLLRCWDGFELGMVPAPAPLDYPETATMLDAAAAEIEQLRDTLIDIASLIECLPCGGTALKISSLALEALGRTENEHLGNLSNDKS